MDILNVGTDANNSGVGVPLTFNHTLVNGAHRLVVVTVGAENSDTIESISVTYGGVSMTSAGTWAYMADAINRATEIFYLLEANMPSDGSNQVSIDLPATNISNLSLTGYCRQYIGVNQTAPDDYDKSTVSASTSISNTGLSASAGDLCFSSVLTGTTGGSFTSHGQSQTELYEDTSQSVRHATCELLATGSVTTLDSTLSTTAKIMRCAAHWSPANTIETMFFGKGLF